MAYAVVDSGGKQYKVQEGEVIRLEKLNGESGDSVEFDKVLCLKKDDEILFGNPTLAGTKVHAQIVRHGRDKKILVFKFKRRKKYRKKSGHRQSFTEVKITGISFS